MTSSPSASHGVCFYQRDSELISTVVEMFEASIREGDAALLVATPEHTAAIRSALVEHGVPLGADRFRAFDASATLGDLMRFGRPDGARLRAVVGPVLDQFRAYGRRVSLYGEMVGLLRERGDVAGAMQLEDLWEELGADRPFVHLCGYRVDDLEVGSLGDICDRHAFLAECSDRRVAV